MSACLTVKLERRKGRASSRHYAPRGNPQHGPHPIFERISALAASDNACRTCFGRGYMLCKTGKAPCRCVLKSIFRSMLGRYRSYVFETGRSIRDRAVLCRWSHTGPVWCRPRTEFIADFRTLARRTLPEAQLRIFVLHYIDLHPWRECCHTLGLERGEFFHELYRIEAAIGYAAATLEPYGLYPVDTYLSAREHQPRRATGKAKTT